MSETIGVLVLLVSVAAAVFFRRTGEADSHRQNAKIAKEAEARRKEQAALAAGEAMRSAAKERDEALKRPAGTVVGDALRRGR